MTETYQLGNAGNWRSFWSGILTAAPDTPRAAFRFFPIPDYEIPVLAESNILAIVASLPPPPPDWYYAGTAYQKILTGLDGVSTPDSFLDAQRFYLGQTTILRFEPVIGTFSIVLRIPFWIREISIVTFEYVGPRFDTVETKLENLQTDLTALTAEFRQFTGNLP